MCMTAKKLELLSSSCRFNLAFSFSEILQQQQLVLDLHHHLQEQTWTSFEQDIMLKLTSIGTPPPKVWLPMVQSASWPPPGITLQSGAARTDSSSPTRVAESLFIMAAVPALLNCSSISFNSCFRFSISSVLEEVLINSSRLCLARTASSFSLSASSLALDYGWRWHWGGQPPPWQQQRSAIGTDGWRASKKFSTTGFLTTIQHMHGNYD